MTRSLLRLTAVVFTLALLFFPAAGAEGARAGLLLCGKTLIPSLFPAFVLTDLALELGLGRWLGEKLAPLMEPLFHLGGPCAAPLALGLLGGYPVGGRALKVLLDQKLCTHQEAQRLLAFCNNSGPGFILGVAGGVVFRSLPLGLFLWLVHGLSALCVGLLLRQDGPISPPRPLSLPDMDKVGMQAVTRAVRQGLESVLQVSAYVVLFQVILGLIRALPLPQIPSGQSCQALLMGMLELTGGVCALTEELSLPGRLALCSFLLGWGGLSVHCQTAALLEETGLSFVPYIQAKLLQGLTASALCLLLLPLFPGLTPAPVGTLSPLLSLALPVLCLWGGMALFTRRKRCGNAGAKEL